MHIIIMHIMHLADVRWHHCHSFFRFLLSDGATVTHTALCSTGWTLHKKSVDHFEDISKKIKVLNFIWKLCPGLSIYKNSYQKNFRILRKNSSMASHFKFQPILQRKSSKINLIFLKNIVFALTFYTTHLFNCLFHSCSRFSLTIP